MGKGDRGVMLADGNGEGVGTSSGTGAVIGLAGVVSEGEACPCD